MTKMKPTTQGKATIQAKPAMVQPPQHQHTTNITISGAGESLVAWRRVGTAFVLWLRDHARRMNCA